MKVKVGHVETFKCSYTQQDFDRFADLTGDNNPIHVDPEFSARTHFGKTVAHGMLLYSTICRGLSTQYPGPGIMQIKQDMMFQSPTYTETEITIRLEVIDFQPAHELAELNTVIGLPDGKLACNGTTTIHVPGWKGGFPGIDASMASAGHSEAQSLKRLEVGQSAAAKKIFSAEDLGEYAVLTKDTNPLFNDAAYCRRLGFRDCIIPGPLLSGMFSDLLGTKLPGRGTNWLKQKLHFPAPAYMGDEITARVEIVRLRPEKDLVNLIGTCKNPSGEWVCQAQSLVLVRDLEEYRL
ncbi:MAG: MaoC family dehydratase [Desulfobacterales bacterium]|jgi:acyl dehydratase